jgi:hypothetical protein
MRRMPTGIIDQAIEPPMHFDGLVNDAFKLSEIRHIA